MIRIKGFCDIIVLRYLNAKDKIKTISLLSKYFRKLVFSGYSWSSLFNKENDHTWNIDKLTPNFLELFCNLKGAKIYINPKITNFKAIFKHSE